MTDADRLRHSDTVSALLPSFREIRDTTSRKPGLRAIATA
jgi:hypothetical protein